MIEWLNDIGFLGSNICLTHAIFIAGHSFTGEDAGEDLEILARTGTSVCHCPVVSARGGKAMESFGRYVRAGVNMGIGTDTFPPDIIEEMRMGAIINKIVEGDRSAGTVVDFYNAATIGGAKALGREDLGRLAAGCTADISIFDFSHLSTAPSGRPHADADTRRQRARLSYGAGGRRGGGGRGTGCGGGRGGVDPKGSSGLAQVQGRNRSVGPGKPARQRGVPAAAAVGVTIAR